MRLAIHAPNLGLSLPEQPFGKDVANRGLYTALATHGGFEQINFCTAEQTPPASLQQQFGAAPGAACLRVSPLTQTDAAAEAGTLLRGQPYLSELAWERGHRHGHQAYSLVGMIHTLAPPKVRELIGQVLLAPVQPWDALICTSPSVRNSLEQLLDRWQHHLQQRLLQHRGSDNRSMTELWFQQHPTQMHDNHKLLQFWHQKTTTDLCNMVKCLS